MSYHGKNGKFSSRDAAHTVSKGGQRFKVVRQYRKIGGASPDDADVGSGGENDVAESIRRAKSRAESVSQVFSAGSVVSLSSLSAQLREAYRGPSYDAKPFMIQARPHGSKSFIAVSRPGGGSAGDQSLKGAIMMVQNTYMKMDPTSEWQIMETATKKVVWRNGKHMEASDMNEAKQKFKAGDIVRYTRRTLQSMGLMRGAPINGKVVGYSGRFVLIQWSDRPSDEPMAAAEAAVEIDKRAMAKRGG